MRLRSCCALLVIAAAVSVLPDVDAVCSGLASSGRCFVGVVLLFCTVFAPRHAHTRAEAVACSSHAVEFALRTDPEVKMAITFACRSAVGGGGRDLRGD